MNLWAKFKRLFRGGEEWPGWSAGSRGGGETIGLRIVGSEPSNDAESDSSSEAGAENGKVIGATLYKDDGDKHDVIIDLEAVEPEGDDDLWKDWESVRPPGRVPLTIYAITYNSMHGSFVTYRIYFKPSAARSAITQLGRLDGLQVWHGVIDWQEVTEDFR